MRIGIVGAGAIGLTFAAALTSTHDVIVLARRPAVAELLGRDGIAIARDTALEHIPVRATTDAHAFADRDAVILAVKAYGTTEALVPLRGVLPPHALVASVQNGLGNVEAARAALPGARVVAGSTTQGAINLGDGRLRPSNAGTTTFERSDDTSPTSDDLAAAFDAAGLAARVTDDAAAMLWRKLVVNAALNPLCALTARANGALVEDADAELIARGLASEAAAVARAEGVDAGDGWHTVEAAARTSAANRNSMLQDLDAGRPTEIEAISGAIVHRAHAHGIAVPLTETVLHLMRARERAPHEQAPREPRRGTNA
jgi:2-dehydropantoate 2-reductase